MKIEFEKVIPLLILLTLLSLGITTGGRFMSTIVGGDVVNMHQFNLTTKLIAFTLALSGLMVNIAMAAWLVAYSRKSGKIHWNWVLFTIIGGPQILILYLVINLVEKLGGKDSV